MRICLKELPVTFPPREDIARVPIRVRIESRAKDNNAEQRDLLRALRGEGVDGEPAPKLPRVGLGPVYGDARPEGRGPRGP